MRLASSAHRAPKAQAAAQHPPCGHPPLPPPRRSGALSGIPGAALRAQFEQPVDRQQLEGLATKFVGGIRAGTYKAEGWPSSMYGISKVRGSHKPYTP